MKKELEDKIFKRFPRMFPNGRDVNPIENLMCFGFSHGDGWFNILWELFEGIEKLSNNLYDVTFCQIKEKFGTLRIYTERCHDKIYDKVHELIDEAEEKSGKTCEVCGEDGTFCNDGWCSTLCETCRKKDQDKWT